MVLIISHLFSFTFINTSDKLVNLQFLNAPLSSLHSAIAVPVSSLTENVRVAVLLLLLYLTLPVISLISQTVAVNKIQKKISLWVKTISQQVGYPQRATVIPPCIHGSITYMCVLLYTVKYSYTLNTFPLHRGTLSK